MKSLLLYFMKNALKLHSSTGLSVCDQLSSGYDSKPDDLLLSGSAITMHGLFAWWQDAEVALLGGRFINYEVDSNIRIFYEDHTSKTLEMQAANNEFWRNVA